MKNYLISICLLLFSSALFAQHDYSGVWTQYNIGYDDPPTYSTSYMKLAGDTIIDSVTYKMLLSWGDSNMTGVGGYRGGVRIDSLERVFFMEPWGFDTVEKQLYDFTVGIGDTVFNVLASCGDTNVRVLDIDSMLINGKYHKTIHIVSIGRYPVEQRWIEGIGSIHGFLNPIPICATFHSSSYLLCYEQGGSRLYTDPYYNGCRGWPIGLSEHTQIAPNVIFTQNGTSTLQMRIDGEYKAPYIIELYDILGKLRISRKGYTNEMWISTGDLAAGYLLYRISNSEGQVLRGRVPVLNY